MGEIKSLQSIDIAELKPYEKNSKVHKKEQIKKIQKSIKRFGFLTPVLIDKDKNIIAGHGRIEAAKGLSIKYVPCVSVEGLTDEERRAYIIADNRLAEIDSEWDINIVAEELADLEDIEFDFADFDFEFSEEEGDDDESYYGDERERTYNTYNLDMAHNSKLTEDFWQMPVIQCDDVIPDDLIGFNYAKTGRNKNAGIHFYLDDYQFERLWRQPEKYIEILGKYQCILSPDFSLYIDMPMPMKIWNTYRSRQIGSYYQKKGIAVIPTISWAEPETYKFCFKGIPKESIVSVSTIGVKEDEKALEIWKDGMTEMIKQIKPQTILVYGGALDFEYGGLDVRYFENKVIKDWKNA